MEFHPVVSNGVKGSADATKVPCPDSVLHGDHRKLYDNGAAPMIKTSLTHFHGLPLPVTPMTYHLTPEQINNFHRDGVLVVPASDLWTADELKLLIESTNEMDSWPEAPGKWMKYFEKTRDSEGNKILSRVENFCDFHSGLNYLLQGQKLVGMCEQLFGEPAVLYKEKINYKLPGGEGFAPHQDVAAGWWMYGQSFHISALIAVDEAYVDNGCLEVVYGGHNKGLLSAPWKEVEAQHVNSMKWEYVPTKPGDLVFLTPMFLIEAELIKQRSLAAFFMQLMVNRAKAIIARNITLINEFPSHLILSDYRDNNTSIKYKQAAN